MVLTIDKSKYIETNVLIYLKIMKELFVVEKKRDENNTKQTKRKDNTSKPTSLRNTLYFPYIKNNMMFIPITKKGEIG